MLGDSEGNSILPKLSKPGELEKDIRKEFERQVKVGAHWFFWIAGLSVVNTMSVHFGWNWQFLIGLGMTLVVDSVAVAMGAVGGIVPLLIDMAIVAVFVLFGWKSGNRSKTAFLTGMIVYALDGGMLLWFEDYRGAAFHGLALYYIYRGFSANNQLRAIEATEITTGLSPSAIQPE